MNNVLNSIGDGLGGGINTIGGSSSTGGSNSGSKRKKSKRIATNGFGAAVVVEESIPLDGSTNDKGLSSSPRHSSQRVKPMEVLPARKSRKSRSSSSGRSSTKKDSNAKIDSSSSNNNEAKKGSSRSRSKGGSSRSKGSGSSSVSDANVGSSSPVQDQDVVGFSQGRNYPVGVLLEDWDKALDFALKQRKKKQGWNDDGAYGTTVNGSSHYQSGIAINKLS